jgi:hypothetical protein
MAGLRIRWRGVARVAVVVAVGLIGLRLLPGLLRAPEPPPLAADVGLPQARPVTDVPTRGAAKARQAARRRDVKAAGPAPAAERHHRPGQKKRRSSPATAASTAVIGSRHRRRHHQVKRAHPHHRKAVESDVESNPPPVPEYVPPPPPEPTPEPPPEPTLAPPPAPGDGSEEFAPH